MLRVGPVTKANNQIIAVVDETAIDQQQLMQNYHLTAEFLRYATDPLERARVCGRQVQLSHFRSLILSHFAYVSLNKIEPLLLVA